MRFLLLTAALVLTGCGGSADESSTATSTPAAAPEDAYISELSEAVPAYEVEPNRVQWIERGWDACQAIAEDDLPEDALIGAWMNLQGVSRAYATAGLQAAKVTLCQA